MLITTVSRSSPNKCSFFSQLSSAPYQRLSYQICIVIYNIFFHPLRGTPAPSWWAASRIPYSLMLISGRAHRKVLKLHGKYGDVVRIAPDEVSFTDPRAWRDIMGRCNHQEDENGKDTGFVLV